MPKNDLAPSGYSIRELEQLSGIKAHTLRIWEQRYQILRPERTNTNIRRYSQKDLQKILNISFLLRNGHKISKLSLLGSKDLAEKVKQISGGFSEASDLIESLFMAQMELDTSRLNRLLDESIEQTGLENTIRHIAFPLLRKVGLFWQTGSMMPGQEHFLSYMIRNKIIAETEKLSPGIKKPAILFFLPEQELHEIPLLYAAYILKKRGYETIYLGQVVPLEDLEKMTSALPQVSLLTVLTTPFKEDIEALIKKLNSFCRNAPLLLSGLQLEGIKASPRTIFFHDPEEIPEL